MFSDRRFQREPPAIQTLVLLPLAWHPNHCPGHPALVDAAGHRNQAERRLPQSSTLALALFSSQNFCTHEIRE